LGDVPHHSSVGGRMGRPRRPDEPSLGVLRFSPGLTCSRGWNQGGRTASARDRVLSGSRDGRAVECRNARGCGTEAPRGEGGRPGGVRRSRRVMSAAPSTLRRCNHLSSSHDAGEPTGQEVLPHAGPARAVGFSVSASSGDLPPGPLHTSRRARRPLVPGLDLHPWPHGVPGSAGSGRTLGGTPGATAIPRPSQSARSGTPGPWNCRKVAGSPSPSGPLPGRRSTGIVPGRAV